MAAQKRAVFADLISLRIKGWYWNAADYYVNVFFRNGRAFQFRGSEGYTWSFTDNAIHLRGWTLDDVRECAKLAGTTVPAENVRRFCDMCVIPDIPDDEFSRDDVNVVFDDDTDRCLAEFEY